MARRFNVDWLETSKALLEGYESGELYPVCFDRFDDVQKRLLLSLPVRSQCTEAKNHGIRLHINSLADKLGCSTGTAQKRYMEALRGLPIAERHARLYSDSNRWAKLADSFCTQGFLLSADDGIIPRAKWKTYLDKSVNNTLK